MGRRRPRRKSKADGPATADVASGPSTAGATGSLTISVGLLADRLRPWLLGGMCGLFVARPLFPSEGVAYEGDGLPMVMLWIALAGLWLLLAAVGRGQFRVRLGWIDAAVLLLIAWHTISGLWAATHASPRPAVNMLWEWIALGLAFLLARQLIAGPREARAVAAVMVALALALSGYGLYQYAQELPKLRAEYANDLDRAMRAAGLWYPPGAPQREAFKNRLESREPYATFALANSLAGYLAPWLVVLAGIAVAGNVGGDSNRRSDTHRASVGGRSRLPGRRLAVAVCAIPVAFCLLLTKSRSAWLATALGVLLVVLLLVWTLWREAASRFGWKVGGRRVLLTVLIIAAAVLLAGGALITAAAATGGLDRQVLSEASKSLGYRFQYWQSTVRMIADHPVVGCGPGNFKNAYTAYKLPEASEEVADPHNFLLEVWATAGTPAALALLAALGCFFWAWWRAGVEPPERSPRSHAPLGNAPPSTPGEAGAAPRSGGTGDKAQGTVDSPGFVLGGAVCGFLLALPLALISAAPPRIIAGLTGRNAVPAALILLALFGMAAGCVALLSAWIHRGRMPRALPAIGVVVLLVNLLAAGGIGFPGVAGSLWLLLALGLSGAQVDRPPRRLPRAAALAALVGALGLGVLCHVTAYGRVLPCRGRMLSARQELADGNVPLAEAHLRAAAEADPLAAGPHQQLAAVAFEAWRRDGSPRRFEQFEQHNATVLKLAPNSSRAWLASGDWYLGAFEALSGARHPEAAQEASDVLEKALEAYRRAVELYPNSGPYHARLAFAWHAAGQQQGFEEEVAEAFRLDDLTPHADKKLAVGVHRRIVQLCPRNGIYRARLALALRAAGDQKGFRREADAALRLDRSARDADERLPEGLRRQLLPEEVRS